MAFGGTALHPLRVFEAIEAFEEVNEWILACLVLHNLLIDLNDDWEDDELEDEAEEHADLGVNAANENENDNINLRIRVQTELLQWFHARTQPN